MALLLLHVHKESIEKIKNVASGEFKIRFLQNMEWKREEKNRSRELHDLHKSYVCCLGTEQCSLQMRRGSGVHRGAGKGTCPPFWCPASPPAVPPHLQPPSLSPSLPLIHRLLLCQYILIIENAEKQAVIKEDSKKSAVMLPPQKHH